MFEIFNLIFVYPITNLLVAIYQLLSYLHFPSSLGLSIILLTVVIRFILYPLMSAQLRSSKKMQEVAPLVAKLKEQYKGNAQRLQAETMLLYKQQGINPAAGCLPVLVQLPVIWGLYSVLQHVVKDNTLAQINKVIYTDGLKLKEVWDTHFFGIPLGQNPQQLLGTLGFAILLVPILTGVSQFIQTKMMLPPPTPVGDKKKGTGSDFATAFQTQSLYIFPLMIGFFSFTFPIGLSLYWITFTVFGIIQQYMMQRGTTKSSLPTIIEGKEVKSSKKASKPTKITQKSKVASRTKKKTN